jgi:hypothetical protein
MTGTPSTSGHAAAQGERQLPDYRKEARRTSARRRAARPSRRRAARRCKKSEPLLRTGSERTANSGRRATAGSTTAFRTCKPRRRHVPSRKLEIIAEPGKLSFTTRRIVDALRALVFEAFTNPEHLKRWMGPRTFAMVSCESDLRVGGRYRFVHCAPDGRSSRSAASTARSFGRSASSGRSGSNSCWATRVWKH